MKIKPKSIYYIMKKVYISWTFYAFSGFVRFIEFERFSVQIHTAYCTFYKILYQKIIDIYILSKMQDLLKMQIDDKTIIFFGKNS